MAEYPINKGIGRPVEFKGLKAQYLFIFCGGLLALFVLFKTANGKKGLIYIQKITAKTGTIEVSPDNWVENTKYSWVQLLTKTVAK